MSFPTLCAAKAEGTSAEFPRHLSTGGRLQGQLFHQDRERPARPEAVPMTNLRALIITFDKGQIVSVKAP